MFCIFKKWAIRVLFFLNFRLFNTVDTKQMYNIQVFISSINQSESTFQARRELHGRRAQRDDPGGGHRRRRASVLRRVLQHDDCKLN